MTLKKDKIISTIGIVILCFLFHFIYEWIPSTLTSISSEAFSNVLALNAIDFTDTNVITIGSKAFAYSSGATTEGRAIGLNSVTLSPTITSIASDAFTGCDMISKINIYNQQQIDVFQNAFIDSINRPTNQLLHDQTTGSLNKLTITSSSAAEGISIPNSFSVSARAIHSFLHVEYLEFDDHILFIWLLAYLPDKGVT